MIDQNKRELMRQAYKLLEDFETPSADEEYWDRLLDECNAFALRWTGKYTQYASKLSASIFDALIAEQNECHK